MEYIIAINMKLAIWTLVPAIGILSFVAGAWSKSKTALICGLIGWGLIFPLMHFLSKVID